MFGKFVDTLLVVCMGLVVVACAVLGYYTYKDFTAHRDEFSSDRYSYTVDV